MDWRKLQTWIVGLIATIINAIASGVILLIVDPMAFNFTPEGFTKLWQASIVLGIWGAANYLKQHPVPDDPNVIQSIAGRK